MGIEYKTKTRIYNLYQLKPGDHIRVDRGVYNHHMLVVKVVNETRLRVIHYTGSESVDSADTLPQSIQSTATVSAGAGAVSSFGYCVLAEVREKIETIDLHEEKVELLGYSREVALYTGWRAVERGKEKIGEQSYNLFFNNCESFVNWCITDQNVSNQGENALATTGALALVGALAIGLGVGAGVILGTKNKKK